MCQSKSVLKLFLCEHNKMNKHRNPGLRMGSCCDKHDPHMVPRPLELVLGWGVEDFGVVGKRSPRMLYTQIF